MLYMFNASLQPFLKELLMKTNTNQTSIKFNAPKVVISYIIRHGILKYTRHVYVFIEPSFCP